MAVGILMPAYNEHGRLLPILDELRGRAEELGGVHVFLVDDCSDPPIDGAELPCANRFFRITLARHAINLGQGAALETARRLALRRPALKAYVTMDADGQHRLDGVLSVARAVQAGTDIVFGDRFAGETNAPPGRRFLLWLAQHFEWALTGQRLNDAHNGLRGFSWRALSQLRIRQSGMAHATEIRQWASTASYPVVEVPVSVLYTPDSLAKGQEAAGALTIVKDLALRYFFGEPR